MRKDYTGISGEVLHSRQEKLTLLDYAENEFIKEQGTHRISWGVEI